MGLFRFLRVAISATPFLIVAACGDAFSIPSAIFENRLDNISLYALSAPPVSSPSGYYIFGRTAVRTDLPGASFDFAFDIDTAGRALLLPTEALHLGRLSGVQRVSTPFDSIRTAPSGTYESDSALVLEVGTIAVLHSRPVACSWEATASHAYFAKMRVLNIDTTSVPGGRRVDLEILADINCGYRGLEPGLPRR